MGAIDDEELSINKFFHDGPLLMTCNLLNDFLPTPRVNCLDNLQSALLNAKPDPYQTDKKSALLTSKTHTKNAQQCGLTLERSC